jgi:glycosyltransferase involved in cell wall biosynthesis
MVRNYYVFLKLLFGLIKLHKKSNSNEFVVFDAYTLMAFVLLKRIGILKPNSKLWYHNHDVALSSNFKIGSLGWIVHKLENKNLRYVDFFSLPAKERSIYFSSRTVDFILPNYPSIFMYEKFKPEMIKKDVNVIFQGRISPGHGLEAVIDIINQDIIDIRVSLTLKGIISRDYKNYLLSKISDEKLHRVKFVGYTDYEDLPKITSSCQIGLAIFQPKSFMHATLGSSSNKIYEYIACGLPIIYLGTEHFKEYLSNYPWAIDVDDSPTSIAFAIQKIVNDYDELSKNAKNTFVSELNYEAYFDKAYAIFKN